MNRILSPDPLISVILSKLIPSKRNPRRVKPERDAHRRMVASIRAFGLLEPLVVRANDNSPGQFKVIAGNRRLAALREIHKDSLKGEGRPPKVPCILRAVDDDTADALSLAENFVREPMHPLDEAVAFAHLAREEGKGVDAIASQFGVPPAYIRQRMKLATLADPVQAAYRAGSIDMGTAEAFAAVPPDRQLDIWKEVGGTPQHAHHVRNVIAHAWIDAKAALFDISKLPEGSVSSDLFSHRVLVERKAFMEAQAEALLAERTALTEEGWSEVVMGPQPDVQDRLWSMNAAPHEYDPQTTAKLKKLSDKREKLESQLEELEEGDEEKAEPIQIKLEELDAEADALTKGARVTYAEPTKAVGTVFLILDPDGTVRKEYRIPRQRHNSTGNGHAVADGGGTSIVPKPPTSDELKESQLATTFTHQALAVREALLRHTGFRKRVLALILHEKVRGESLAIRHEANGTTLHADHSEGFSSSALDTIRKQRAGVDPFIGKTRVDEEDAFHTMKGVIDKKLDALIDVLTVDCITAHLQRRTDLVWRLARELEVNIRTHWRPDEKWLAAYQKVQLSHLIVELRGPLHAPADTKKKSELVSELAKLFADAAEGRIEDKKLAERLNGWLPLNMRDEGPVCGQEAHAA